MHQLVHRLVAILGALLQAAEDDRLDGCAHLVPDLADVRRRLGEDARARDRRTSRAERILLREEAEETRTGRPDVDASIERVATDLLRRHVVRGPDDLARARELHALRHRAEARERLGEPEIEHAQMPFWLAFERARRALRDEQILGLEVPVNDPVLVRLDERLARLDEPADDVVDGERAALGEDGAKVASLEVLHDEVRKTGRGLPDVVDADDVLAPEARHRPSLALEARDVVGIGRHLGMHDLDRDARAELLVTSDDDLAHPTRADRPLDHEFARDEIAFFELFRLRGRVTDHPTNEHTAVASRSVQEASTYARACANNRAVSYLVLARKYRPQSFDDLIGQEHVAQTLANAIAQDRVAHAFLFTGVRGVGKTTSARILAKCLNCLGADGKAKGPTSKPCQVCSACTEVAAGVDMDVQEIDAASYNGVDEVRRLQEGLAFRPARDRFKIYIVDEVHMLSNAAWNAFLKTLEEPPPHVKFIFATTEVHKVPVTILSRCQRYDFKLVSARQIGARLKDVVGMEKLQADDAAVSVLAREAAGSMRDAMSLLDQVIAFGADNISADVVAKVLGVADREVLHDLTSAMIGGDAGAALDVLDKTARQGFDMVHLWKDLMRHVRNLVVAKVCNEEQARELLDLADEEAKDVLGLAAKSDTDDLSRIFTGLSRGFDDIVKSGQVRSNLEMTLVRLARRPPLLPLDELLSRLGELEKRLATGAPPPPARGGGGGGGGRTRPDAGPSITSLPAAPSGSSSGSPFGGPKATAAPHLRVVPSPDVTETSGSLALDVRVAIAIPAPSSPPPQESEAIKTWRLILDRVRKVSPPVAATLDLAIPVTVTRDRLVVGVEDESFEDMRAEQIDARAVLITEVHAHFGTSTEVVFERAVRGAKTVGSIAYLDMAKRKQALVEARHAVELHPLVQHAIRVFDGELRDVKLPAQEE